VQHTYRFSVALRLLQPDETHIAAGMSDGTLSVRRRQPKASETMIGDPLSLRSGASEFFLGGSVPRIGRVREKGRAKSTHLVDFEEFRVESRRTNRLKDYDKLLKTFKYSAALDSVLRKVSACIMRLTRRS
jgi:U3 small nucleolar RNA-associated protein 15